MFARSPETTPARMSAKTTSDNENSPTASVYMPARRCNARIPNRSTSNPLILPSINHHSNFKHPENIASQNHGDTAKEGHRQQIGPVLAVLLIYGAAVRTSGVSVPLPRGRCVRRSPDLSDFLMGGPRARRLTGTHTRYRVLISPPVRGDTRYTAQAYE